MRICRIESDEGRPQYVEERDGRHYAIEGDIFGDHTVTDRQVAGATQLAPLRPRAIIGVGLNYRRHAAETGAGVPKRPIVFMKPPGAVQDPGKPVVLPRHLRSDAVDYECELAIVIGSPCKNVSAADALDYVLGYTCANDVSARDWQIEKGGSQWCRGKSFDTFAPLGPCIVTTDELGDASGLAIRTELNGEVVQDSNTADMIFGVRAIVEFLSGSTTLETGTVILTGTPQGVGMAGRPPRWLRVGDYVTIEIEGIGRLENPVIEEQL